MELEFPLEIAALVLQFKSETRQAYSCLFYGIIYCALASATSQYATGN